MALKLSKTIQATFSPPVMEARRWLDGLTFSDDKPLLNLSQAAPVDPPPEELRAELARIVMDVPEAHIYGPVLGLPDLRACVASDWSLAYGGQISPEQVAITSGCNQAFCAAIAAVAAPGDAVMLPTPFYFNHRMYLETMGIEARLLPTAPSMIPDPKQAETLIDDKLRAIVLVTPNNPTGAEYPAGVISAFADLARSASIALIVDETYRDFHSSDTRPHDLFASEWQDVLIHLYSFSKVFRLTGHRVGAMIASPQILAEVEKYIDSVAICPNQLGQHAALYGLEHLGDWVKSEREEVLARRAAIEAEFTNMPDAKLLSCGAYFAYVELGFEMPSNLLAEKFVAEQGVLILPGTMFGPSLQDGGDGSAERTLRIAFANADTNGIKELGARWRAFSKEMRA